MRKTLKEAIADGSCTCSGQRREDAGAGDAGEYYKNNLRGAPWAIGIEPAPPLSICGSLCALRCEMLIIFFLPCDAQTRDLKDEAKLYRRADPRVGAVA